MHDPALFKWRHFEADIILCAVRWYLRYALSDRDVATDRLPRQWCRQFQYEYDRFGQGGVESLPWWHEL